MGAGDVMVKTRNSHLRYEMCSEVDGLLSFNLCMMISLHHNTLIIV